MALILTWLFPFWTTAVTTAIANFYQIMQCPHIYFNNCYVSDTSPRPQVSCHCKRAKYFGTSILLKVIDECITTRSVLPILTKILSVQGLGPAPKKTFEKASVRSLWCLNWSKQLSQHFLKTSTWVLIMYINLCNKLHA